MLTALFTSCLLINALTRDNHTEENAQQMALAFRYKLDEDESYDTGYGTDYFECFTQGTGCEYNPEFPYRYLSMYPRAYIDGFSNTYYGFVTTQIT